MANLNQRSAVSGITETAIFYVIKDPNGTPVGGKITAANVITDLNLVVTSDLSAYAQTSHTHAAGDITSGALADARISQSSVVQHQGALTVTESQISDFGSYLTAAGTATLTNKTIDVSNNTVSNIGSGNITADIVSGLTEAATPASADFLMGVTSGGALRKFGIGNLPAGGGGATSLDGLTDVTITAATDGEVIGRTGGVWVNRTLAAAGISAVGHSHTLSDITDSGALAALNSVGSAEITNSAVTFSKIQDSSAASVLVGRGSAAGAGPFQELTLGANLLLSGTVLSASGGAAGATNLNELADVTITSAADGHVLQYASGVMVNRTLTAAGIASSTHNHDADYAALSHNHDADYAALNHNHAASEINSGTFADARIAESNVTQHIAAIKPTESLIVPVTDEATAITAGVGKMSFRPTYAMTLTEVRASLRTEQTGDGGGGIFTVDINKSGTSILSTKLTIDNGERTSTTAATPAVISSATIADDEEISIDIDQIGDGTAVGLKVAFVGART